MIPFDTERVRANVRDATTEDLLDRLTVYRAGMEPEALAIIAEELRKRAVPSAAITDHAAERAATVIAHADGTAIPCSFCDRPAVAQGWGLHRIWGLIPVFPRYFSYCTEHQPQPE